MRYRTTARGAVAVLSPDEARLVDVVLRLHDLAHSRDLSRQITDVERGDTLATVLHCAGQSLVVRSGDVLHALTPQTGGPEAPWHTDTFEVVCWEGEKYGFGPKARQIVKRLWEAWEAGRPDVEANTLLRVADADTRTLSAFFANNKAWGKLIVKGAGSSCYRLAMRCASEPPTADPAEDEREMGNAPQETPAPEVDHSHGL